MSRPLSQTAALRLARRHVSLHSSGRGSWTIVGPWRDDDPHGPYTETSEPTYWQARERRGIWVASLALTLMGRPDLCERLYSSRGYDSRGSIPRLMRHALRGEGTRD